MRGSGPSLGGGSQDAFFRLGGEQRETKGHKTKQQWALEVRGVVVE